MQIRLIDLRSVLEKHNGGNIIVLSFLEKKLFAKIRIDK